MSKLYFAAILQLFLCSVKSQTIQFKCYLKGNCDTNNVELDNYTLKKDDFIYYSLNSGSTAILPDTGTYTLSSPEIIEDTINIHVDKYGLNISTIKPIELYSVSVVDSKPGKIKSGDWLYCGKLSEGYKVDYYGNGNKYLEGVFKKGKPVGELKYYDATGKLVYIKYYTKRGKFIKSEYLKM